MGFSGTRRKALELWKSRYVFSPPEVIAQGLLTRLRGHREVQLEQTWESLNVSSSSLHYCSHAITDFSLPKQHREIESKQHEGFKIPQFYHSWWVFLFSSSSSFPQKSMHIIFTLGVSASLVLLFRQLTGCKPALQNQTLPFILGFSFIILSSFPNFIFFYFLLL